MSEDATQSLSDKTIEELALMEDTSRAIIKFNNDTLKSIEVEYQRRYAEQLESLYQSQNKEHGSVKLALPGGWQAKGDISRTIKYDSDKLMTAAAQMPWDDVKRIFDIAFKVPEKQYKTLEPGSALKQAIDDAREVEYKPLKVKLEYVGESEAG